MIYCNFCPSTPVEPGGAHQGRGLGTAPITSAGTTTMTTTNNNNHHQQQQQQQILSGLLVSLVSLPDKFNLETG